MATRVEDAGGVYVIQCDDWDDFIRELRNPAGKVLAARLYRGQRLPVWPLSSPWERIVDKLRGHDPERPVREIFAEGAYEDFRDAYLREFKSRVVGAPTVDTHALSGDDDWWALGRHHGLTTPLLDWTRSPFIAAFFAFSDLFLHENPTLDTPERTAIVLPGAGSPPVAVWELAHDDRLEVDGEFDLIRPSQDQFYRQKAQSGWFTRLTHDVHVDVQSYLTAHGLGSLLGRYEIPAAAVTDALGDLDRMNITFDTVFPDADGAARQANLQSVWDTLRLLNL